MGLFKSTKLYGIAIFITKKFYCDVFPWYRSEVDFDKCLLLTPAGSVQCADHDTFSAAGFTPDQNPAFARGNSINLLFEFLDIRAVTDKLCYRF